MAQKGPRHLGPYVPPSASSQQQQQQQQQLLRCNACAPFFIEPSGAVWDSRTWTGPWVFHQNWAQQHGITYGEVRFPLPSFTRVRVGNADQNPDSPWILADTICLRRSLTLLLVPLPTVASISPSHLWLASAVASRLERALLTTGAGSVAELPKLECVVLGIPPPFGGGAPQIVVRGRNASAKILFSSLPDETFDTHALLDLIMPCLRTAGMFDTPNAPAIPRTAQSPPFLSPLRVPLGTSYVSGWAVRLVDGVLLLIRLQLADGQLVDVSTLDPDTLQMPSPLRAFFRSSGSSGSSGCSSSRSSNGKLSDTLPSPHYIPDVRNIPNLPPPAPAGIFPDTALFQHQRFTSLNSNNPPQPDSHLMYTPITVPTFNLPLQSGTLSRLSYRGRSPNRRSIRSSQSKSSSPPRKKIMHRQAAPGHSYEFILPQIMTTPDPHLLPPPPPPTGIPPPMAGSPVQFSIPPAFTTTRRRSASAFSIRHVAYRQRTMLTQLSHAADLPISPLSPMTSMQWHEGAANPLELPISTSEEPMLNQITPEIKPQPDLTAYSVPASALPPPGEIDLATLDDIFTPNLRGFHTSLATASFRSNSSHADVVSHDTLVGIGPRTHGPQKKKEPPQPGLQCAMCGRTESPEWRRGLDGVRNLCNACGLRITRQRNAAATQAARKRGSKNS